MSKRLSRRTVLRGIGGGMMLPWLEVMAAGKPPHGGPPLRMGFFYLQNGIVPEFWFPRKTGADFELPPSLEPLAPVRDEVIVFSGLDRVFGGGTDVHAQCASCWMTSAPPTEKPDGMFPIDATVDQRIAAAQRKQSVLPSLELTCNTFKGNKESKYLRTISWFGPGSSAKAENDPRAVYRRLFGMDAGGPVERSILDIVRGEAKALRRQLSAPDRRKVDEYFESVRSIERRMTQLERRAREQKEVPLDEPSGMPAERSAYIRMMGDLIALAFQLDLTRVVSMMFGPERWNAPQFYDGVFDKPEVHHTLTHAMDIDDEARRKVALIDRFRVAQYAYLVQKLGEIPEGEGTLLDRCVLTLGAGLGNGNLHNYDHLATVTAGRGIGPHAPVPMRTGRHVRCPQGTPLANLWLSLLARNGLHRERFADSTAPLDLG